MCFPNVIVHQVTGRNQTIGLGWLDDSMTPNGPTEEDGNYIADTGASTQDMSDQVNAYRVRECFVSHFHLDIELVLRKS